MQKIVSWLFVFILVVMLSNVWAQQSMETPPAPTPMAATQELTREQFFQELLTVWQNNNMPQAEQLVTNHPSTAGQVYQRLIEAGQGEGEKARTYRALASFLEQFPIVKMLAQVERLNQQVVELYLQGKYAEAIPLAEQALGLQEQALGPEHRDTALSLNNLAELYRTMGAYAKAEPLYQRALVIWEKVLGPDPGTAGILNNLALLYRTMGAYTKAEPLYQRALAIREKVLGPEHPGTAQSLNNLALLYETMGGYAQAEPLLQRALAILEKALGPEHPATAASLDSLALLYSDMGEYTQAEPLLQRALAILEKALGPEHPDTATGLNNLALLYQKMGAYAKAEPIYQRALAIDEKTMGPEHPSTAASLTNLAALYAAQDQPDRARTLFLRVQQIDSKLIEQIMGFTSEAQKLDFLAIVNGQLHKFLSLVSQQLAQNPSARKDALDVWLQRKGVVLEAQKRFQDTLFASDDPDVVKTVQDLAQVRTQLTQLTFGGPGKEGADAYQQSLTNLKTEKDRLEASMSRLSQKFAVNQKAAKANTTQVAAALPAHTALLEFARVSIYNFKTTDTKEKRQPAHYLAFILFAGNSDDVRLIDLGDVTAIDQVVATFKQMMTFDQARGLTRIDQGQPKLNVLDAAHQVYQRVFAPLRQELGDVTEVFISPDGNLNLIPFEVLTDADGRFLIETYAFNYLAAGRDLIAFGAIQAQSNPPVLIGDPDFDAVGVNSPPAPLSSEKRGGTPDANVSLASQKSGGTPDDTSPLASEKRGGQGVSWQPPFLRSADMSGFAFKRLPGTRAEVKAIQGLLTGEQPVLLYTDQAAQEAELQRHPSPRILHLATHGFFLADQDLSDFVSPQRGAMLTFTQKPVQLVKRREQFENPLIRSGIALAGANTASKQDGATAGIVTAEKILGLQLRGTELVVLSACETGLGEVQSGEGVFGLRRAFTQAGTNSLVMSLWSVPDTETKELMVQFYQNLLDGKLNRREALRQAALHQMEVVNARYGKPLPYYWGAFVFLGEP